MMKRIFAEVRVSALRNVAVILIICVGLGMAMTSFTAPLTRDPEVLLKGLKVKFNSVKDYSVANTSMLNNPYTAIYVKDELVKGVNCAVVKVIPNDGGEVVISTMWIDPANSELKKFTTTTKANGTFDVQLTYDPKRPKLVMPTQLLISFDVDKIQLPKGVSGDLTGESAHVDKVDKSKSTRGQIVIDYANYKINQGLKDAIFVEKKK